MTMAVLKRASLYLLIFALLVPAASIVAYQYYKFTRQSTPPGAADLPIKIPHHLAAVPAYDLLLLGDSRTLTNLHPDLLEPWLKGLKAVNLGHWANWFPTQYSIFEDVIPALPKDTLILWTVGHQNFGKQSIEAVYPIGWDRMMPYMTLGFDINDLIKNQFSYVAPLMLFVQQDKAYRKIQSILNKPLVRLNPPAIRTRESHDNNQTILRSFKNMEGVGETNPWFDDDGKIVGIEQYKLNGAYLRTEIDSSWYRAKQQEHYNQTISKRPIFNSFEANPASWTIFIKILELCQKHNVSLIVNELEEAPYVYRTKEEKDIYRRFMKNEVQKTVEEFGFPYIRVNLDLFGDETYFDYNHMNGKGVERYNELIGPLLSQTIRKHYPNAF